MNLSYKKCKELKDAGFPQNESGTHIFPSDEVIGFKPSAGSDAVYVPTLEELIEACAKIQHEKYEENIGEFCLQWDDEDKDWICGYMRFHPYEGSWFDYPNNVCGPTPSEAVANLYIALHK